MSTEGHALAYASNAIAQCQCGTGFWSNVDGRPMQLWEAHVDRIAHTPRVRTDPDGREHDEADPQQYDREEDDRLARQLGEWPEIPGASER